MGTVPELYIALRDIEIFLISACESLELFRISSVCGRLVYASNFVCTENRSNLNAKFEKCVAEYK
jgi:hypothetical protein